MEMETFKSISIYFLLCVCLVFVAIMAEQNKQHEQEVYQLQAKLDEKSDMYDKAVMHIEILNKEREVE